jgi:hypothetical protein
MTIPVATEQRVDRLRNDGIRLQVFDALFDAAATVLDQADHGTSQELAAIGKALLDHLLTPRVQDRIQRLEDRLVVLVSDAGMESFEPRARIADVASRPVASLMPAPRISGESGPSPVIGLARIGAGDSSAITGVVYDSMQLRSSGAWLRLPVGTVVRSAVEPVVLATIGEDSITPERGTSRPPGVSRRRESKPSTEPVEQPVEAHAET